MPPDPPQNPCRMSYEQMVEMMRMDDRRRYGRVTVDQLEWQDGDERIAFAWDAQACYGGDYHKLWLKTEGVHASSDQRVARRSAVEPHRHAVVELAGRRAPRRRQWAVAHWLALGVEGLAPGFFDIEAAIYIGEEGRTALRPTSATTCC